MKRVKNLTDTEIKRLKSDKLQYKVSDGQGLFLVVKANGTKMWRYDFTFGGKRKSMSFGTYPNVSLKEARELKEKAIKDISNNINPINVKKEKKENQKLIFENISNGWLKVAQNLSDETRTNYLQTLEKNVYPLIGKIEIHNIKRKNIVYVLQSLNSKTTVAHRVYNLLKRIFSYSAITYDLEYNPVDFNIGDIVKRKKISHHKTLLDENDIKDLMQKIKDFKVEGFYHPSGVYALKFMPYMFVRISTLLQSKWDDIDFENETWFFPKEITKTNEDYLYPMPKQVINLLMDLNDEINIKSEYIFISAQNNPQKHMSRDGVYKYLAEYLKYKGKMTLHGFRSTFSTTANKNKKVHGFDSEIIEACLSHAETRQVKKAYDRDFLEKYIIEKRCLIQWYADWLDNL